MLFAVLQKEFAAYLHDARLRWAGAVLLGLFAVALLAGATYYRSTSQLYAKAQDDTYRQWLEQGEKNPHSAAHYGLYAYKPVPLLAVLDRGMDDYLGSAVWLEAHNQNEVRLRPVQDAGPAGRFGALTVGFVWQFILPLLIFLLGYNAVSREYESGTLRMLLSTQVRPRTLVFGKALGLLQAVLLLLFLPMVLLSGVALWLVAGSPDEFWHGLPAFGWLVGLYALFAALCSVLSVLFSTWLRTSSVALTALLGLWAIGAFLVPRVGSGVARALHPSPSALHFTKTVLAEREKGVDGQGSYEVFQKNLREKVLRDYGVDSLSQLPVSFAGLSLQASEDRDYEVYDRHYGQLFQIFRQQDLLLDQINLLSPTLAMRSVSRALAGTDLDKHLAFTRQAEEHRRLVARLMNDDQTKNGVGKERGYKATSALWQQVPQFQYQHLTLPQVFVNQLIGIGALLLWLLVSLLLLLRCSDRLRPA